MISLDPTADMLGSSISYMHYICAYLMHKVYTFYTVPSLGNNDAYLTYLPNLRYLRTWYSPNHTLLLPTYLPTYNLQVPSSVLLSDAVHHENDRSCRESGLPCQQ